MVMALRVQCSNRPVSPVLSVSRSGLTDRIIASGASTLVERRSPATCASVSGRMRVRMNDRYLPEIKDQVWPKLVRRLAAERGFAISDIDRAMRDLRLPMERTHTIMGMALDSAFEQDKVKPGCLVVMTGSGVGYHQAASAFRM
jgi:3-oxoacyl-[acyl-carrier-protein] synthase-3